jgi:predicted P-loop ATPase
MPIDVRLDYVTKSVTEDLSSDEIDQIWGEAYQMYLAGEDLYLSEDAEELARVEQAKHAEQDERSGLIEDYLDRLYPSNWADMDLYDRRLWLNDPLAKKGTEQRQYVCVAELWCECLGKDKTDMSRYNTRDLNDILKSLTNWEAHTSTRNFPLYGKQKYYKRKDNDLI